MQNCCMVKTRFAQAIDTTLFVVGASFVVYAWVNKYVKLSWVSIIITGIVSFVAAKIIWSLCTKKYNKRNLKTQELKFAQNCIDYLALNPSCCQPLFLKIIQNSKKLGNFLIEGKDLYYFDYSSETTNLATITKIYNKLKSAKCQTCFLFTSSISPKAKSAIDSYQKIEWVADYDAYLMMKDKNTFPITEQKNAKLERKKWKNAIKMAFERKKAKSYLGYGILLLAISFILPYTILYCVVGTIFVLFALLCLILKNNKKPITQ